MPNADMPESADEIRARRDRKVKPILEPLVPIWLVAERLVAEENAVLFNVVFQDPAYGWLNRRYRYDAYSDVLYRMGERRISEAEAVAILQEEPYLNGGRA